MSQSKSKSKVKRTWSDSILLCHHHPPLKIQFQNSIHDCDIVECNSSLDFIPDLLLFDWIFYRLLPECEDWDRDSLDTSVEEGRRGHRVPDSGGGHNHHEVNLLYKEQKLNISYFSLWVLWTRKGLCELVSEVVQIFLYHHQLDVSWHH